MQPGRSERGYLRQRHFALKTAYEGLRHARAWTIPGDLDAEIEAAIIALEPEIHAIEKALDPEQHQRSAP